VISNHQSAFHVTKELLLAAEHPEDTGAERWIINAKVERRDGVIKQ